MSESEILSSDEASSEDELEIPITADGKVGAMPYSFEPEVKAKPHQTHEMLPVEEEQRLGRAKADVGSWCRCNTCKTLETDRDCFCCDEIREISVNLQGE